MFYLRNLRVRLQERRNRLYKAGYRTYKVELRYFLQFLDDNPYTQSLLETLDASAPLDFEQWVSEQRDFRSVQFPDTEDGRAKVCLGILRQCASDESGRESLRWCRAFSSEKQFDAMLRDFSEAVLDPFINFLHDRIDDAGNVLYLIERFKLRAEWFDREGLYGLYEGRTATGEANLDQMLRRALFEGGVDYPFSQPSSPSGKADVVALLGSEDPLVLEIKVFDPDRSKGKAHLRQGFHQISRYATDYNQSLGYLVIFNCSGKQLVISSRDGSEEETPTRITYGGKTFFVVAIDVHPDAPTASVESPSSLFSVYVDELTGS